MFGSLIYIFLDISFNILYWTGNKTITGVSTIIYYLSNNNVETIEDKSELENINNQNESILTSEDMIIIKNQVKNQHYLIIELKQKINILEKEINNTKFINDFNIELDKLN